MKGITILMLGLIIGILLFAFMVVFILMFHQSDFFTGLLKGISSAIRGFFGFTAR
jgi:hypothetical protein